MTRKRGRRAAESRADAGRPHAGLTDVYRRGGDTQTGVTLLWEPLPDQAPIAAEIFKRLLSREPANGIAADLNNRGIPTGGTGRCAKDCGCRAGNHGRPNPKREGEHAKVSGRWIGGNLSKLALNPTYAGLRARNSHVLDDVRANWPPIITEAQNYGLVALYGDSYREKGRRPEKINTQGGGLDR